MKKLLTATLAVALVFGATGAFAQTIAVSADPDGAGGSGPFTQVLDSPVGLGFDIVIWMDSAGEPSSAAEFIVTELLTEAPGVFKLGTIRINNTPLDIGDNLIGEYIIAFGSCEPVSSQLVLVRVTYGDFSGAIGADLVMNLRGFQPGDTQPSTFDGEPGFVDCTEGTHTLVMGGVDGGVTGSGVVFPDGSLGVNPTPIPIPNSDNSVGQLKARF
jgi:hypothetical protein